MTFIIGLTLAGVFTMIAETTMGPRVVGHDLYRLSDIKKPGTIGSGSVELASSEHIFRYTTKRAQSIGVKVGIARIGDIYDCQEEYRVGHFSGKPMEDSWRLSCSPYEISEARVRPRASSF